MRFIGWENYHFADLNIVAKKHKKGARTNLMQDVTWRLRCMFPKMDFMENKREDCTNFDNEIAGFFILHIWILGSACPHFKVKKKRSQNNSYGWRELKKEIIFFMPNFQLDLLSRFFDAFGSYSSHMFKMQRNTAGLTKVKDETMYQEKSKNCF